MRSWGSQGLWGEAPQILSLAQQSGSWSFTIKSPCLLIFKFLHTMEKINFELYNQRPMYINSQISTYDEKD